MSNKRSDLMSMAAAEECSEAFIDALKSFIDDIEFGVNEIKDNLDITDLDDLCKLSNAKSRAESLSDELY